jgi:exopolysaccharide production protein ExoQ
MSTELTPLQIVETTDSSFLADLVLATFCLLTFGLLDPNLTVSTGIAPSLQRAVDAGAPDLINQLTWLAVAGLGAIVARNNLDDFRTLVIRTWPIIVVFGYCLVSASWSDQPFISLRRCFGLMIPAFCILSAVAACGRPERAGRILYLCFWVALLGNLVSLPLSGSFDSFGLFKGITTNKNILGGMGALAILVGVALSPILCGAAHRVLLLAYLAGWSALLVLSISKTSIALAAGIPILFGALAVASLCLRMRVGVVTLLMLSTVGLIVLFVILFMGMTASDLASLVWPDTSFSGRTQLWDFMFDQIERHWLVGSGFGSFWGAGSQSPNLYAPLDYIRLTNQAHNGYIDLTATIGLSGLLLTGVLLVHAMRTADLIRRSQPWLFRLTWFVLLFSIIHNTMESSLLVPFALVWHILLLTYVLAARAALETSR